MKQIKVFAAIAIFLAADQISKAAAVMSLKGTSPPLPLKSGLRPEKLRSRQTLLSASSQLFL